MQKIISNRIGFSFAIPVVVIGVAIIIVSIVMMSKSPVMGLFSIVGGFMCTSMYGTEIDIQNKKFREYGSVFGIKTGKWNSLDLLPDLSLMSSRSGFMVYSRSNRSTSDVNDYIDVCLLSQNHRTKIVVQKFSSKKEATEFINKLSIDLDKPIKEFNPAISEKTLRRRSKQ